MKEKGRKWLNILISQLFSVFLFSVLIVVVKEHLEGIMQRKSSVCSKVNFVETGRGKAAVFGPVCSDKIEKRSIDISLKGFRPAEKQKQALKEIASIEDGFVFIAVLNEIIIGYLSFHPTEPFERWGKAGLSCILELGAIEVALDFRGLGIARQLMEVAFCDGRMEDYIVIATEYYWHWDLEGTGLLIWEYRTRLEKLMAAAGLVPEETTDPEINAHPANVLMVRVGSGVSLFQIKAFEKLRLM